MTGNHFTNSNLLTFCRTVTFVFECLIYYHLIRQVLVGNVLTAVWSEGKDVSNADVMRGIIEASDLPADDILKQALTCPEVKLRLYAQTKSAVDDFKIFGVPSMVLDGHLFWGSESNTLDHVESVLQGNYSKELEHKMLLRWDSVKPSAVRRR